MSDKIKELARKAGLIAPYGSDREGLRDFDYREFAELIVKECAQLVQDNMDPQNAWITPSYVKQHFGVEE
jgi:hypothetical protein